jgi:hypothetical protein
MITLIVSIGWITVVAMAPETEPIKKGLNKILSRLSLGSAVWVVDVIFGRYLN